MIVLGTGVRPSSENKRETEKRERNLEDPRETEASIDRKFREGSATEEEPAIESKRETAIRYIQSTMGVTQIKSTSSAPKRSPPVASWCVPIRLHT